jgi:asparagine synthase (glutamine-hydrolysing)
MSGIAGIIRFDGASITPGMIEGMTMSMEHRGPDGIRHWISGSVALGQCMMRTTPESLEETQPLANEDESLILVMDGRIDNWDTLRDDLVGIGARLRDRSDAELVLRAYERWGSDCLRRIVGDFAFVIWDSVRRKAFCARDQLGARPFFYHWDGCRFVFASELHPTLAIPWVREELNEGMVAEFLANDMVSRDETLWHGVNRLVAAHQLVVTDQRLQIEEYWTPDLEAEIRYRRDEEYVEHYRSLLDEEVRRHSRSNLPIACEVSGGIDSSAVFAVGEHLRRTGNLLAPGLEGFTLCFDDGSEADEIEYAREVGIHLGRTIHEIAPCLAPLEWYQDWARRYRDFPHYPNTVMSLDLNKGVRDSGIRSVLTGYGGDEWQMGSRYYYADLIADLNIGEIAGSFVRDCRHYGLSKASYWFTRFGIFPYLPPSAQKLTKAISANVRDHPPDLVSWLTPELRAMFDEQRDRCAASPNNAVKKKRHAPSLEMLYSATRAHNRESFDLLSASVGVEKRDPMNSLPIVQFHFSTPESIRLKSNQFRWTHREAVKTIAPGRVMDRSDKAVFSPTIRRHLSQFEKGGTFELSNVAPSWVDPVQVATHLMTGRSANWPLWVVWSLFGCILVSRSRKITKSYNKNVSNPMRTAEVQKAVALNKPYSKPALKKYGSVAELTRGINGSNPDAGQGSNTKLGGG